MRPMSVLLLGASLAMSVLARAQAQQSILGYHGDPARSGHFLVPSLTFDRARSLRLDESFRAQMSGHVYSQPLYWRAPGSNSGILIVATEDNVVVAIDAASGKELWNRSLGKPVPRSSLACGNISPLGVTGTPSLSDSAKTRWRGLAGRSM